MPRPALYDARHRNSRHTLTNHDSHTLTQLANIHCECSDAITAQVAGSVACTGDTHTRMRVGISMKKEK
jgi:hypothetical protein